MSTDHDRLSSPPAAAHAGERSRVLVVDADAERRLLVAALVSSLGFESAVAATVAEAVAVVRDGAIDLVLIDIDRAAIGGIDGIDGIEACAALRRLPGGDATPLVFVGGGDDAATQERATAAGADDVVRKPIQPVGLLLRVRALLRLKHRCDALLARNAALGRERVALAEVHERRRAMTAFIVHDLKNPLTGVLANTQWLLAHAGLEGDERAALRDVALASDELHRMLVDLQDVDRSEAGDLTLRTSVVALDALLAECVRSACDRKGESGERFVVSVAPDLPTLALDRERMLRALAHLVDSALKFAPKGTTIALSAQRSGADRVRLAVRDEGPEIPEEKRARLFDVDARLDPSADPRATGSRGLGLAFCRVAVEAHGGRIGVESAEPRGAIVYLELPVTAGHAK